MCFSRPKAPQPAKPGAPPAPAPSQGAAALILGPSADASGTDDEQLRNMGIMGRLALMVGRGGAGSGSPSAGGGGVGSVGSGSGGSGSGSGTGGSPGTTGGTPAPDPGNEISPGVSGPGAGKISL